MSPYSEERLSRFIFTLPGYIRAADRYWNFMEDIPLYASSELPKDVLKGVHKGAP